jgi:hypothetical protein
MNFNPTWLYIKQHNRTGLKYFGKTVQDPYKYKGSGVRWLRHLSKHGDEVSTIWSQLFTDKESLTLFALEFSQKNNIVESKDGLMGGDTGITLQGRQTLSEKSASRQHSKDTKEKIRQKRALQVMPKGRVVSEETKKKISESQKIRMSKRKTL